MDALESDGLRAFAVFARHLNLTAAAAELHLAQPSLHAKIGKLARELGTPLYERDGRGLRLTPAGEKLAWFAQENVRRAKDFIAELDGRPTSLTIAAGHGTFRWVIGEGVRGLVNSGRELHVRTANREQAITEVAAGRADVGVFGSRPPPPHLASTEIARYPQVLMLPAGHPLTAQAQCTLKDLAGLPLLLPPPERPHRQELARALLDAGVSIAVAAEVDGWDLMTHFVALGLGAAVVNGCVSAPENVVAIPIRDLPDVRYWAVWRPERTDLPTDVLHHLSVP
ncbi:LysR family transcriptional regulator [Kineosporia babensis]|uniref:LysR family transcriptional regulator n=1 Tax=Kineosporia babensis TaxID=499548 RepID=A0A9X1NN31_9ACTN|nr:LysR family transcriptional regulator [Kineosporia babensis]MCD5316549.1 LysR family transcriptional regulator [Kineosporia babensis]